MKTYKRGFYGGKFLPFHKGHKFCISVAAKECDELFVILFVNSEEEIDIIKSDTVIDKGYLSIEERIRRVQKECCRYDNVQFAVLDCAEMHKNAEPGDIPTWDSETEYVLRTVGDFEAVYSSEPSYDEYFKRAYPFAFHRLIDPPRVNVPICGTLLRNKQKEFIEKWL